MISTPNLVRLLLFKASAYWVAVMIMIILYLNDSRLSFVIFGLVSAVLGVVIPIVALRLDMIYVEMLEANKDA